MNINEMVTLFRRGAGDRAAQIPDTDIKALIQTAWKTGLADELNTSFNNRELAFITSGGKEGYNLDTSTDVTSAAAFLMRTIQTMAIFDSSRTPIRIYTSPDEFYKDHGLVDTTQARPLAVLWYNRDLTFRPVPDQVYTVYMWGTAYNSALLEVAPLTPVNDTEAIAATQLALRDYALDLGWDAVVKRADAKFNDKKRLILGRMGSNVPVRRERMSF